MKSDGKTDTDASLFICLTFSLVCFPVNGIAGLMCFPIVHFIKYFQNELSGDISSNSLPEYENSFIP